MESQDLIIKPELIFALVSEMMKSSSIVNQISIYLILLEQNGKIEKQVENEIYIKNIIYR